MSFSRLSALAGVTAMVAGLALSPISAVAQSSGSVSPTTPGPYVSLGVGFALPRDTDFERPGVPDLNGDLQAGFAALGALGMQLPSGFRGEVELSYRGNDVDSIGPIDNASGDANVWAIMANLLYEADLGTSLSPYFGGGIGLAVLDFDNAAPIDGSTFSDGGEVFAYQGIAGFAWKLNQRLHALFDYRYFVAQEVNGNLDNGAAASADYAAHTFMVGLRVPFGRPKPPPRPTPQPVAEPAPAPAPAPAPEPEPIVEPPRSFIVFFDFDSSRITPEAESILAAAADYVRRGGQSRIIVTGHADRAGAVAYNQALSERRASAVQANLVGKGIEGDSIITRARGETDPLVSTADGVREPQNRRVEITFGSDERLN